MTEEEERRWIEGRRSAYVTLLGECLRELNYGKLEKLDAARLIYERELAIAQLRSICKDFGDNDWEPTLNLADIIDKHLGRYLEKGDK